MKKMILIFLLLLPAFGYTIPICESLFGDSDLYRTIQSLAELRLRLDLAQTSNDDSITFSLLKKECEQKEKAILKHVLQAGLMTQEHFKKLIKLEISNMQRDVLNSSKERQRQKNLVDQAVYGRIQAQFHFFESKVWGAESFEIMATPVTRAVWRKLLELQDEEPIANPNEKTDLFPITEISFHQVKKWIDGLNSLSENGDPTLEKIFKGHKKGDIYQLPSHEKFKRLVSEARAIRSEDSSSYWKSMANEEVTTRRPFNIQGNNYFGLSELPHFTANISLDGEIKTVLFESEIYTSNTYQFTLVPQYVAETIEQWANHDRDLTFRLVRERKNP